MSAFVVTKASIDVLVSGVFVYCTTPNIPSISLYYNRDATGTPLQRDEFDLRLLDERQRLFDLLVRTNVTAVAHRYGDADLDDLPGPRPIYWDKPQAFKLIDTVSPAQVAKVMACYEYQTSEHPRWGQLPVNGLFESLSYKLLTHLPGYAEAPRDPEHDDVQRFDALAVG